MSINEIIFRYLMPITLFFDSIAMIGLSVHSMISGAILPWIILGIFGVCGMFLVYPAYKTYKIEADRETAGRQ